MTLLATPRQSKMFSLRTTDRLYNKLTSIAAVETCRAETDGIDAHLSVNALLNLVADKYVTDYERNHGELPEADDKAAVKKYVRKK